MKIQISREYYNLISYCIEKEFEFTHKQNIFAEYENKLIDLINYWEKYAER